MTEVVPAGLAEHWDARYGRGGDRERSWFQRRPDVSLELLVEAGAGPSTSVLDVGGGASRLVDHLVAGGWRDVTVLDVSTAALGHARDRVGETARVTWTTADVRAWRPQRRYDVWHDRAVFHFFVDVEDRDRYLRTMRKALAPGGLVVVGAFAADGPTTCSGLPVARFDADALVDALGSGLREIARRREEHRTPRGDIQPFTWVALRAGGVTP